ncbi:GntR family transcriptional regulator [Flexivirga endophytica]|uniref:GntR family transcriptional regulator n=1 Tax=Flexivirga endophytica TaxID=1849103 RepID=A0A916T876_9MICO|nr:GntR family transcriptional regulator [Flexivirga endophytica]GGB33883.1 GntR family transcriptional regulator [Flexivirga endophytica]GHB41855.1 GntR family transcriptional regulator [Flexivirga endophytica]
MTKAPAKPRALKPVVRQSTAAMIADSVRGALERGDLPPGSQLGEADLAKQLGVSRGPLREGLQRLTQEGLLLSIRNRGLFVIEMTPDRVRDMYVARQAVERAAAEQIHLLDAPEQAGAELMEITDAMTVTAEAEDATGVGEADIAFHDLLVRLAGSTRLSLMHRTLLTETRMGIHALDPTYEGNDSRAAEHRAIAQSFIDHDPATTDRLLQLHMADAVERLVPGDGAPED